MKYILLILTAVALLPFNPSVADDLLIKPGSEEWKYAYEPDATRPVEIQKDNPLRKELFNLARPKIEKLASKPVLFTGSLKGYRNWALFEGSAADKNGKAIRFDEFESDAAVALFLRTSDGWVLVDADAGHTDVFYEVWIEIYGMPGELLKY